MIILIDIGNSRLKWGIEDKGQVHNQEALDYREDNFTNNIIEFWKTLSIPTTVAISAVGSNQLLQQLKRIAQDIWPGVEIVIPVASTQGFGVTNAYRHAEKLGIDRWLNLLALHHYYPGEACVVSCGTAITVDFLTAQGQHLGGLISPGLTLMKKSLFQGTANLQFTQSNYELGLADFTEQAIHSGTLCSAVGMIQYIVNKQKINQLILTGGDAAVISEYLEHDAIIDPDLVLKGLAIYCKDEKGVQA